MHDYAAVWQVAWSNPYTAPTGPRVLAEERIASWPALEDKRPPAHLVELAQRSSGYGLCWSRLVDEASRRRWSKEARARERVRRLRERVERKWPMFAEQIIAEALAAKPAYYRAEDPFYDKGR